MIIFEYKISPSLISPDIPKTISCVTVTSDEENNVTTCFRDEKYLHTIPASEIDKIKSIIKDYPELFRIPKHLKPNAVLDGSIYSFIFSDGKNTNSFSGSNILECSQGSHEDAALALRVAGMIKEKVLDLNGVETTIPTSLQQ